ncbi:Flp pilus assembly protein, protease CpaA [Paraburkholderia piptadeniae]|uniref:Flp pilus assembly protein, protease CpaA n=1 Tax=Paraburkholderia piptadeniae TaxID=1701573 RepID=A0A1N7SRY0_9BURK|nr:prepilin peptidase [Paraburkholderia piptadeniae]SIT50173.1 Flp pilus assembly protein, protease CpaA [Paraburkholderia piptadeniae]
MNAFEFPIGICLLVLLATAAGTDLHSRRIPNWLVLAGLTLALAAQWWQHGAAQGYASWGLGVLTGGCLFLPLYLLRGMGAGDVKLMAMVGAFVGPELAFEIVLVTCTIGGIWALAVVVFKRALKSAGTNMLAIVLSKGHVEAGKGAASSVGSLPYGVAIAIGTLSIMILRAGQSIV